MNIKIQGATEKDYSEINKIFLYVHKKHFEKRPDVFKNTSDFFTKEQYNDILNKPNKRVIKILWDENIVGACMAEVIDIKESSLTYGKSILSVDMIGVIPIFQNRGIGTLALDYLKKMKEEEKLSEIRLTAWYFNNQALGFYEKNSFNKRNCCFEI